MINTTLCIVRKGDQILLALKKRGFGAGKWNGAGGKVHEGESIRAAAVRELYEEVGISTTEDALQHVGTLDFAFETKTDWNLKMFIFLVDDWYGIPIESEEMKPEWFQKNTLPFEAMWKDDPYWLPLVLEGKALSGDFLFTDDGDTILRHTLNLQASLAL